MNGVHDMGGQQGMGPVVYEKNEPVFHAPWEGRMYALTRAMRAWRKWNLDTDRHTIRSCRRFMTCGTTSTPSAGDRPTARARST